MKLFWLTLGVVALAYSKKVSKLSAGDVAAQYQNEVQSFSKVTLANKFQNSDRVSDSNYQDQVVENQDEPEESDYDDSNQTNLNKSYQEKLDSSDYQDQRIPSNQKSTRFGRRFRKGFKKLAKVGLAVGSFGMDRIIPGSGQLLAAGGQRIGLYQQNPEVFNFD